MSTMRPTVLHTGARPLPGRLPRVVKVAERYTIDGTAAEWARLLETHARHARAYANDPTWCGVVDEASYLALTTDGWVAPIEQAKSLFASVRAYRTRSFIPTLTSTDEPGDVDVAAYLANADLCFTATTDDARLAAARGRVAVIEHDLFTSGCQDAQTVVDRGIIACGLAHMLERAGMACEIRGRFTGVCSGGRAVGDFTVRIKPAHGRLHWPTALYWLAHPSVLRLGFHSVGVGVLGNMSGSGYSHLPCQPQPNTIRTDGLTVESMDEWITRNLAALGVRITMREGR